MVIGDPYTFAIIISTINAWNPDSSGNTFCNGILFYCVDGEIFPKEVLSATLKTEILDLRNSLTNLAVDETLYGKSKDDAFAMLLDITFPTCDPDGPIVLNDYRFDISPCSCSDHGYHIFAVSNGDQVRILAAKVDYDIEEGKFDLQQFKVSEAFVSLADWKRIVQQISNETTDSYGRWFPQQES